MPHKILIADDDPDILEFLTYNLRRAGYTVFTATGGNEALTTAQREKPDLIILDIMMLDKDGVMVCRELRERPEFEKTLIVFFTALTEDYSQIAGFDVGADDFISKPIKIRVFLARVNSLLTRRAVLSGVQSPRSINGVTIDNETRMITSSGQTFHLPRKEFEMLKLLVSKPGRVFTRDEIFAHVWGKGVVVSSKTIDVHIRKIRERVGEEVIRTVKGVGYKFNTGG